MKNIFIKFKFLFISLTVVVMIGMYTANKFILEFPNSNKPIVIGIIDGPITKISGRFVSYNSSDFSSQKTHGDMLIKFARALNEEVKIYYFNANNSSGKIDTEGIMHGLNWMDQHDVKKINISLSSKVKSAEFQDWISNHREIKVFASYNNLLNSIDYPAMYMGVYGSGTKTKIKYKDIDKVYRSDEIVILPDLFHVYKGNSYLSLLSTLTAN